MDSKVNDTTPLVNEVLINELLANEKSSKHKVIVKDNKVCINLMDYTYKVEVEDIDKLALDHEDVVRITDIDGSFIMTCYPMTTGRISLITKIEKNK